MEKLPHLLARSLNTTSSSILFSQTPWLALVACLGGVSACSGNPGAKENDAGTQHAPPSHHSHDQDAGSQTTEDEDDSDEHNDGGSADVEGGTQGNNDTDGNDTGDAPTSDAPAPGDTTAPGYTEVPEDTSEPEPAPETLRSHFFLPTPEVDNTGAPHLKLDANGGMHAAFPTYVGKGAYYAYCDADCDGQDDVKTVRLETELNVSNALVELTADGHPRVLLNAWDRMYYAQCDADCSDQASWKMGALVKHDNKAEISGEAFALDKDGNPHFIFHSYIELFGVAQRPPETHIAACTNGGDCTSGDNWTATKLADEIWEGGALRFDEGGGAHLFASQVMFEVGVPSGRLPVYAECAANCGAGDAEWTNIHFEREAYEDRGKAVSMRPALSMELTDAGQPRALAMFKGDAEDERWITYMECDGDCTASMDSWTGTVVSDNSEIAAGLDLALDADDRPRLAYNLGYSIFLASCDTGDCTKDPLQWDIGPVELGSEMPPDQIILWPNCNVDAWFLHSPNLVITADGNPKVGYQAADLSGGGVPDPDPDQSPCSAGLDMTWTRLTNLVIQ